MGKRQNLIAFLGEALNDADLKENADIIKLGNIVSNAAPKRTSTPLTQLKTKTDLLAILELSSGTKMKKTTAKKALTKSAKSKPKVKKKAVVAKSTKTKKRS